MKFFTANGDLLLEERIHFKGGTFVRSGFVKKCKLLYFVHFTAHCQNYERDCSLRLFFLSLSLSLSVRQAISSSVRPYGTTRLSLDVRS